MKRLFKALAVGFLGISVAVFGAVVYGTEKLPDEITAVDSGKFELNRLYDVDMDCVQSVGADMSGEKYQGIISAMGFFPVKNVTVNVTKRKYVAPGGDVFGIKLYTKGIMIVGIDSVTTDSGSDNPAESAGLKCGDVITHINGKKAISSQQLTEAVENSNGGVLEFTVERNGESSKHNLTPSMSVNGKYKAGIWVRDSCAGIGTVTFYDNDSKMFAGLGHGVCDVDTGKIMPLNNGEAVKAKVNGFYKSTSGNPGELCGVFSDTVIGLLSVNHEMGVYGTLNKPAEKDTIPVALENEVELGAAKMITTIDDGGPQYYDI
jgi:stage IV sporulation protein B